MPVNSLNRRTFLSRAALGGLALGTASPMRDKLASLALLARNPDRVAFAPAPQDSDVAVFAAARKQFLFPASVTYCNTGTLGASPRTVVDAMNRGVEKTYKLKTKIPVYIGYFTAWVDRDGTIHFYNDIYGHDARLSELLLTD